MAFSSIVTLLFFITLTSCHQPKYHAPAAPDGAASNGTTETDAEKSDSGQGASDADLSDVHHALDADLQDSNHVVDGDESHGHDTWQNPNLPALESLVWQQIGKLSIDDYGRSEWIEAPFAANQRFIAIRIAAVPFDASNAACYRIESVKLESGATLVEETSLQERHPVCSACSHRVMSGHGYGIFVFPNNGEPLDGPDTLRFRVQMRECGLHICASRTRIADMPTTVAVEMATEVAVDAEAEAVLRLGVAVAPGAELDENRLPESPVWAAAWEQLEDLYADAKVDLQLERIAHLSGPTVEVLEYGPGDRGSMDALYMEAMNALSADPRSMRFVPLILVPCLQKIDPINGTYTLAGQTSRIPGGGSLGESASACFIATTGCSDAFGKTEPLWFKPEQLGVLMAHELGHYLGLHHSDTWTGQHLGPYESRNLMDSKALFGDPEELNLTTAQIDALRRHPDLFFQGQ